MKKCLVLGGGFAGLSSAVYLSKAGFKVELIEASPKLGGRAYSFTDQDNNTIIDNGQHILMGCYRETLDFFREINALDNLDFQKRLQVNFVKENFRVFPLKAFPVFYPLNLILGILNYKALKLYERLKLLSFFFKMNFHPAGSLSELSVYDWLEKENQDENIRKAFWEILCAGALNTNIRKASAKIFADILKQIFFTGRKSAAIVLPKYGLTETYCLAAQKYIKANGGEIKFTEKAEEIIFDKDKAVKVLTSKKEIEDFDFVVSALPLFALEKIAPEIKLPDGLRLTYSSILTIHIWLNENKLEKAFYGLINSKVHWIFNHSSHLTLVISDANDLVELSKEEIFEMVAAELEKFVNISSKEIKNYRVIKEKRATFIPSNYIIGRRPEAKTQFRNFFLAGDWVETGLPSTIESAVKSGKTAAQLILNSCP